MQSDKRAPPKPRLSTTVSPNWFSRPCQRRTEELPTNTTPPGRGGFTRSKAAKLCIACAQRPDAGVPSERSAAPAHAIAETTSARPKAGSSDGMRVWRGESMRYRNRSARRPDRFVSAPHLLAIIGFAIS